jgi:hypothetical protein
MINICNYIRYTEIKDDDAILRGQSRLKSNSLLIAHTRYASKFQDEHPNQSAVSFEAEGKLQLFRIVS